VVLTAHTFGDDFTLVVELALLAAQHGFLDRSDRGD
jgi:hypothetical protein